MDPTWIFTILTRLLSDSLSAATTNMAKRSLKIAPDWRVYLASAAVATSPAALLGLPALTSLPVLDATLALISGMTYTLAGFFFSLAMAKDAPIRVALILRLGPLATLAFGIAMGERLTWLQAAGFGLGVLSTLVTIEPGSKGTQRWGTIIFGLMSSVVGAWSMASAADLLRRNSFEVVFLTTRLGMVTGVITLIVVAATISLAMGGKSGAVQSLKVATRAARQHPNAMQILLLEQAVRLFSAFLVLAAIAQTDSAIRVAGLAGMQPFLVWLMRRLAGSEDDSNISRARLMIALGLTAASAYLLDLGASP